MAGWIFVRHGQSEANRDGWYAGTLDSPLTALGIAQAHRARADLHDTPWVGAVCSDLSRARETAKILLQGRSTPLRETDQLRERDAGHWQRRSIAEVAALDTSQVLRTWRGQPPGGESLLQVAVRATAWLAALPDASGTTLVVAHGALMRAVLGALDDRPEAEIGLWHPPNCDAVHRDLAPGTWQRLHARLRQQADGEAG